MSDQPPKPCIYDYTDFRLFLEAAYKHYKSMSKSFSYRFIAQRTGASSAGWFPNIVQGRINLTRTYGAKLAKLLKLDASESEYFEQLIAYSQAGSAEDKNACLIKLKSLRGIEPALLQQEHLAYLTKWYISAIRELLFIYPFKGDFKELAKMVIPQLKEQDAEEAINVLETIGMISHDDTGNLRPRDAVVMKDPSVKTDLWKTYMKSKLSLGRDAIDTFTKDCRDISEVYMPLSAAGFNAAKAEIAKLRKKLLVISENDKGADRVYQCELLLFPLTEQVGQQPD